MEHGSAPAEKGCPGTRKKGRRVEGQTGRREDRKKGKEERHVFNI